MSEDCNILLEWVNFFVPTKLPLLYPLGLKDITLCLARKVQDSNTKHSSIEYITLCDAGFASPLAQTQESKMETVPNEASYISSGNRLWI